MCGTTRETIFHTLFSCHLAHEVWRAALLPLPPAGFSPNYVFLNIHYLVVCTWRKEFLVSLKRTNPWLLWHIWKAMNSLVFEKLRLPPQSIFAITEKDSFEINFLPNVPPQILAESTLWSLPGIHFHLRSIYRLTVVPLGSYEIAKKKTLYTASMPSFLLFKPEKRLNFTLCCGRLTVPSLKLDNIIFESSFPMARASLQRRPSQILLDIISKQQQMGTWSLDYVLPATNSIVRDGPHWLHQEISREASAVSTPSI